jgi:predicted nucleic acid-binding protein
VIVVDTGPLVAALDADDADHGRCLELLEGHPGPLMVPAPVLTEVCWLHKIRTLPSPVDAAAPPSGSPPPVGS